ncbi:SH3 domain-containing protein [Chitinispirillales bacterium ANBcel5]|uniref:SH3 domain-containing protein n=1 Tax=Cellulosispirillum alkaliphilum TaxID=3039283 RepID=UPI002A4E6154|nr:SH3 domain-containing protein [Chitinispirillales bacterium ANBcel5]
MNYRVVKEYSTEIEHPIRIEQGEILQVVEESDSDGDWADWVLCKGKHKEGWVPKQYLDIKGKRATSLRDYDAQEHNLAIDELLVASYELNGWIWAVKENAPETWAWAPLNHLKKE